MTRTHRVTHKGHTVGIVLISPHPELAGQRVGSLMPVGRSGKSVDETLEIEFKAAVSDVVPDTFSDNELIEKLLGRVAIQPSKVQVVPDHPLK